MSEVFISPLQGKSKIVKNSVEFPYLPEYRRTSRKIFYLPGFLAYAFRHCRLFVLFQAIGF